MKKKLFILGLIMMGSVQVLWGQHAIPLSEQSSSDSRKQPANVVWNQPSRNSSESMPCGGGDIGMNVWVEEGDLLFYVSRSGTFDENNCQLKQGRFRLRLSSDPQKANNSQLKDGTRSKDNTNPLKNITDFRQELKLNDGYVEVRAGGTTIQLWADVFRPVVYVEVDSRQAVSAELFYENWRYQDRLIRKGEGQQCSYKWAPPEGTVTSADSVFQENGKLYFVHRNPQQTVFDRVVSQQGLDGVKAQLMNPLGNLTFGGCLSTGGWVFQGTEDGVYAGTDYRAWRFRSHKTSRTHQVAITLHSEQISNSASGQTNNQPSGESAGLNSWKQHLQQTLNTVSAKDKAKTRAWWNAFWQRSFIHGQGEAADITRNYTLFRYMLGCNAYSSVPTKFNGGLFTFDPCFVDEKQAFTPDYRKWGGGTMTAQNQRLVYWPMLKSGDADMMSAQFDFYNRMLRNAELRSETYWQHKGACFAEQIENFGLPNPAEYGFKRPEWFDKGLEYNAWLEYEWDTVLEFCQMILETNLYAGADITPYLPLIENSLTFFDEHYRYLSSRRGRKDLDENGHLVLFPGSACETYKMTNNASSTIAALRTVLETFQQMVLGGDTPMQTAGILKIDSGAPEMLKRIPPIPLRTVDGKEMIAPAKTWERVNNVETPQLYPVFPWRIYGLGTYRGAGGAEANRQLGINQQSEIDRQSAINRQLEIARNTYLYDTDAQKFRSHIGWKQDNIWAACLGLTDEARRLALLKLGDGPHRFPAFWGPGYDWTPDHNWGGSGMIGLQEMLLQTNGREILLFPAWPKEWDVHFKLHATGQTTVEAELKNGKIVKLNVFPESRKKDIVCSYK